MQTTRESTLQRQGPLICDHFKPPHTMKAVRCGNSHGGCCVGNVRQICFTPNQHCAPISKPTFFPPQYIYKHAKSVMSTVLGSPKEFKFQTIAPVERAYGTGQVKCSDLAKSPKTDESRVHVRRRWVCWHWQCPE